VFLEGKSTCSNTGEYSSKSGGKRDGRKKRRKTELCDSSEGENFPEGKSFPEEAKSSKEGEPSKTRKRGKRQKEISNTRLVELLKKRLDDNDSVEKIKGELIAAKKRNKKLEEQNKINSFANIFPTQEMMMILRK
jgi:hypothetical protein